MSCIAKSAVELILLRLPIPSVLLFIVALRHLGRLSRTFLFGNFLFSSQVLTAITI